MSATHPFQKERKTLTNHPEKSKYGGLSSSKNFIGTVLLFLGIIFTSEISYGQITDEAHIRAQREGSNKALRSFDIASELSFLSDNVLITTGAGTLLSGKEQLKDYIQNADGPRMYWVRTPEEIVVNYRTLLAWERGVWKGFHEDTPEPVAGGKYAAQWTKKSGKWLIQSELFVGLNQEE